jgi:HlyD family secretion protein
VIFRKVALERLSSPEQLDQLLEVTTPIGWVALAAVGALLAAGMVWGLFGSIPTLAPGEGILLRRGGVMDLVAMAGGQVDDVLVRVGDVIEKGQRVASIRQQGLERQMLDFRAKRAVLDKEYQALAQYAREQLQLKQSELEQQRTNLQRNVASLDGSVKLLADRVAAEQKLLDDGLITKQTLLTSQEALNGARNQLASAHFDLADLQLKRRESEEAFKEQLLARSSQLRDLDSQIHELQAKLKEDVAVVSP